MSAKTLVCFYTEGATDKVFYDNLLEYLKGLSKSKKFSVDKVEKSNIGGIGKFASKLLKKFKSEILPQKKKNGYRLILFLCYDKDVFELVGQKPPIDRKKLEKDLLAAGADKVIHIVAESSIEDVFLSDEQSIVKSLKLKQKDIKNIPGSGYHKLCALYRKANKVYYKGDKVEDFVEKLNMSKICSAHCKMFQPICNIMFCDLECTGKGTNGYGKKAER